MIHESTFEIVQILLSSHSRDKLQETLERWGHYVGSVMPVKQCVTSAIGG